MYCGRNVDGHCAFVSSAVFFVKNVEYVCVYTSLKY